MIPLISNINPKKDLKIMKKIFSWGMMLAAAFTLTNCAKEMDAPVQEPETSGYPFEIVASTVDTKTVNDGMSTKWTEKDSLNVFHAAAGSTQSYGTNDKFIVSDLDEGRFKGNLTEKPADGQSYDWYVLYPYSSKVTTPAAKTSSFTYIGYSKGLNQKGYNSMASLKGSVCPLYGVAKSVPASEIPSITLNHLSSVVAINVTNKNDEPLKVTSASLTAEEEIVGSFYIDFTQTPVEYSASEGYTYKTATVNVSEGTALAKGESATLYLAIKPFEAKTGQKLILSVNDYKKTLTMTKDVTFHAGKIKTLNFFYDYVAPAGQQIVTFDFTSQDELTALGVTLPEAGKGTNVTTLTKGDVTLVAEGGSTTTRVWNSSGKYDLRAYKGAMLTLSVPSGYVIDDVLLTGGSLASISKSAMPDNPVVLTVADGADTQKISTITVKYSEGTSNPDPEPEPEPEPEPDQPSELDEITVAEFLELKDTATEYTLTGKITRVGNTTYGNFDITDATGTVYVYGLLTPDGAAQKQWAAAGLKQGDVITVKGKYNEYNGDPQVKDAVYVSHKAIKVDNSALTFAAEGGSLNVTATLVNATDAIAVSVDNPHFSVVLKSGTTYTVTAPANDTDEALYANLTFTAGDLTAVVTIAQDKPAVGGDVVAGGRDDFNTVAANSSYSARTTTAGWKGTNCAVMQGGTSDSNPTFKFIGSTNATRAFTMNGKTSAKGQITSPTLTTGCGTLSLKYGHAFSESNGVDFTVTIKQNGTAVKTYKVDVNSITQNKAYTWEQEVNVAGNFVIEITNNCPSNNSSKNKDRVSIWDVEWTGYAN